MLFLLAFLGLLGDEAGFFVRAVLLVIPHFPFGFPSPYHAYGWSARDTLRLKNSRDCAGVPRAAWLPVPTHRTLDTGGRAASGTSVPQEAVHGEVLIAACSSGAGDCFPPWVLNHFRMWATLAMRLLGRAAMPWEA